MWWGGTEVTWLCVCVGLALWVDGDDGVWLLVAGHQPLIIHLHKGLDLVLRVIAAHIFRLLEL